LLHAGVEREQQKLTSRTLPQADGNFLVKIAQAGL